MNFILWSSNVKKSWTFWFFGHYPLRHEKEYLSIIMNLFSINLHSFWLTTNMIDALLDLHRILDLFVLSNTFLFLLSTYEFKFNIFYHLKDDLLMICHIDYPLTRFVICFLFQTLRIYWKSDPKKWRRIFLILRELQRSSFVFIYLILICEGFLGGLVSPPNQSNKNIGIKKYPCFLAFSVFEHFRSSAGNQPSPFLISSVLVPEDQSNSERLTTALLSSRSSFGQSLTL